MSGEIDPGFGRSTLPWVGLASHAACASVLLGMVLASAQPIITDDVWLHLGLGGIYAEQGPVLEADPFLHTAETPPASHGWLADLLLHEVVRRAGFVGLRFVHASMVVSFLLLAWWIVRREGRSPIRASLVTAALAMVSAYRLVQLRPQLFSMVAVLVLFAFFLRESAPIRTWKLAAIGALSAVWANVHAAFLLGPILSIAAAAGTFGSALLREGTLGWDAEIRRTTYLVGLAVSATIGACLNPDGVDRLLLYFIAGEETASLQVVVDEWGSFPFLSWPGGNLPPTPAVWMVAMALFVCVPVLVARELLHSFERRPGHGCVDRPDLAHRVDPALLGLAAASLIAMAIAVRFLWLAFFPMLLVAAVIGDRSPSQNVCTGRGPAIQLLAAALLAVAFYAFGPWSIIGQFTRAGVAGYERPYPPERYHAHAVWFLQDAAIQGNLFNPYFMGNFLAYWLSPEIKVFTNGSLQVSNQVLEASRLILARLPSGSDRSFSETLDRYAVDIFLGVGLPDVARSRRPWHYSTTHLEGEDDWILVFRNLDSAVYLRRNARNVENLERVSTYYRGSGIPFDPTSGFDVDRVVRSAPAWSIEKGLVPADFMRLQQLSFGPKGERRTAAAARLASIYAALGLYDRAVALDSAGSALTAPDSAQIVDDLSLRSRRRLVWSLLRSGDVREARKQAMRLESIALDQDRLSLGIVDTAREASDPPSGLTRAHIARLPLFDRFEAAALLRSLRPPPARSPENES